MNKATNIQKLSKRISALGFKPWVCGRGLLHVSAENGDDAADYYGEFRGGYPWVNPKLETLANEYGNYWEWDNPVSICLCQ